MRILRKGSFLFTLSMFLLFLSAFLVSLGYQRLDRLVPLVVLTPALVMTIYCLVGEFVPRILSGTTINVASTGTEINEEEAPLSKVSKLSGRKGLVITLLWLLGFAFLALLVGFVISIPIALFVFLKVLAGEGWLKSLAVTVLTSALIIFGFGVLMKFELFRGILFGEIVII